MEEKSTGTITNQNTISNLDDNPDEIIPEILEEIEIEDLTVDGICGVY